MVPLMNGADAIFVLFELMSSTLNMSYNIISQELCFYWCFFSEYMFSTDGIVALVVAQQQ